MTMSLQKHADSAENTWTMTFSNSTVNDKNIAQKHKEQGSLVLIKIAYKQPQQKPLLWCFVLFLFRKSKQFIMVKFVTLEGPQMTFQFSRAERLVHIRQRVIHPGTSCISIQVKIYSFG